MAAIASDYRRGLQQLLPPGPALPREDGAWLTRLLDTFAQELARIDARALRLIEELDPRTALELLPDWERICGLPDACSGTIAVTVPERRAAILAKLTSRGGQSIAYLTTLAAALGYSVAISEFRPLRAGFHSGDRCGGNAVAFAFRVDVMPAGAGPAVSGAIGAAPFETDFRAGAARAGDRLRSFGTSSLECVIRRVRPAHTTTIFAYPDAPVAAWSFDFTE